MDCAAIAGGAAVALSYSYIVFDRDRKFGADVQVFEGQRNQSCPDKHSESVAKRSRRKVGRKHSPRDAGSRDPVARKASARLGHDYSAITIGAVRTSVLRRRRRPSARLSGNRHIAERGSRVTVGGRPASPVHLISDRLTAQMGSFSALMLPASLPAPPGSWWKANVRTCCTRIRSRASRSRVAVMLADSVPHISYDLSFDDPQEHHAVLAHFASDERSKHLLHVLCEDALAPSGFS